MNVLKYTNYTYTTKFILPLLFTSPIKHHEVFNNHFINAYIADMANKENDDRIHLLFADYPSLTFQNKLPNPIAEYRYKDGFVIVYPLQPPWEEDYIKFISGKYSEMSNEAQQKSLSFWEQDDTSLLWGVFNRKGETINKYMKEKTGSNTKKWTRSKEWWLPPEITEEILGLE